MSGHHLHLIFTHAPIVVLPLSLFLYLVFRRIDRPALGFCFITLGALLVLPVYFTGEEAEHAVQVLPGLAENKEALKHLIHEHEEMAEKTFVLALITGALAASAAFLTFRRHPFYKNPWLTRVVLALLVLTTGAILYTANLGGVIHRPEWRTS